MHYRPYYRWLMDNFIMRRDDLQYRYSCLLDQLYRKGYYFIIENDGNRAEDGLYLRYRFQSSAIGADGSVPEGPCSFLEFLIGVSIQLQEMLVDGSPVPVNAYLWELMNRLNLLEFTDEAYGDDSTRLIVDQILNDFMDRAYSRCGEGGLFPLRGHCRDQGKVEVWYQLNAYLLENPEFFER